MVVGIVKEIAVDEFRVAMIPEVAASLMGKGVDFILEPGAGIAAGFPDAVYVDRGIEVVASRSEVFEKADVVLQVRTPGASGERGQADVDLMREGLVVVGGADALTARDMTQAVAQKGALLFALELIPRITRAQSMDILSSMATVAGYKAVLLAAQTLPRMFPMLMTASGTVRPARVLVIGGGVAGLQAIATARRLGAVVQAYDVRPAVREQVESLGADFVDLGLDTQDSEDAGGYARAQSEEFYDRQREALGRVVAENNVVISTAAIPGKPSPVLIIEDAVRAMAPGSVIVDLAAERGGNCVLTQANETVVVHDVQILGPTNLPATVPYHASQMFANNVANFLELLVDEGELNIDLEDEIVKATLVTQGGEVVNEQVKGTLAS
ncbi:MAG: NAD(P) transhydrogenase subunit alpha [Candidatus Latescibacteria bacterium]|nr:NAD(P) transhydrogenase subunit alpha [Candidatus Latescibacterota bacterium]